MRKLKVDVVDKVIAQDEIGNVLETFQKNKSIYTDYFIPISQVARISEKGFHEKTTHLTYSYEDVAINSFLQYDEKTFHVLKVFRIFGVSRIEVEEL